MVTLTAFNALLPNFTSPNTMLLVEVLRSAIPLPLSVTCCGLVDALSPIVKVAPCAPTASGVNAIPIVHDVAGATVIGIVPHVPVPLTAYSGSVGVALEMTSALVLPVLLIVTFFVTV